MFPFEDAYLFFKLSLPDFCRLVLFFLNLLQGILKKMQKLLKMMLKYF